MDGGGLSLLGGGGGGCGGLSNNSTNVSTAVDADQTDDHLELGLGLSLGGGGGSAGKGKLTNGWGECGRILTAKDFPSHGSNKKPNPNTSISCSSNSPFGSGAATKKRAADSVSHEGGGASPTSASQVVGWPPIRAYRMNSLVNLAKAARGAEDDSNNSKSAAGGGGNGENEKSSSKDSNLKKIFCNGEKTATCEKGHHLGFVKVNMDGVPIGRKIDLNAHGCYETLAQTLEDMFFRSNPALNSIGGEKQQQALKPYMLLDGSSEFVLTYEDKDGDWMLVGDVPWQMFLSSVKRLRIMRTSEANGLAAAAAAPPRFEERSDRQRSKPS